MPKREDIKGYLPIWLTVWFAIFAQTLRAEPVLVTTDWVADHLNDSDVVLLDMSVDPTQYRRFHLPGARYLPYDLLVKKGRDEVSRGIPDQTLFKLLGRTGISPRDHVVIYDDFAGLQAGRLFWELERVGHPRVSVMDGGLVRWILERRKVVAEVPPAKTVSYAPAPSSGRENEIDLTGVEAAVSEPGVVLLDVRTPEEYRGEPRERRSGHIPGARLWPWEQAVDFNHGFSLKPARQILSSLRTVGIEDKQADLVLYCRTGHRVGQTYMTLRHLGFDRLRLYDGSMAEYARFSRLPVRKGDAP
jgi:thiosulfate/3-mercaptopyruvate sulfurtransferase